ncbi:MAG: adenosylcobinamide amidohydrolase [Desulfotignum sp.]|nr:adenosylcobinamide amidohydrolase [Desulfotignum sp.]
MPSGPENLRAAVWNAGTINIILMTNMALSPRAMTRSLIAATEAKTAALADLDIRSSDDPALWQATGTGTDNILVVQGTGQKIDGAGGGAGKWGNSLPEPCMRG